MVREYRKRRNTHYEFYYIGAIGIDDDSFYPPPGGEFYGDPPDYGSLKNGTLFCCVDGPLAHYWRVPFYAYKGDKHFYRWLRQEFRNRYGNDIKVLANDSEKAFIIEH